MYSFFPVPKINCETPLGMESGKIQNASIAASTSRSSLDVLNMARLHFKGKEAK